MRQTPLDVSICAHAILQPGLFVVPDTTRDARFAGNPLVTGAPHLRFYAGALLETAEGLPLGTLCVLDHKPRPEGLTPQQGFALQVLARQVMSQLELRRALLAREARGERRVGASACWRTAMPQMVWSTQPDGIHDYYNARWYEFTGVPAGSTDGEGWNGMFHPEDQARAWERWRHSLATGEPYEIEYRLRRADGEYRWTLGRALPVRDEQGRIERWFGTCTDIEEQKQTEDALRISEERLRLALSAAEMVGTFNWDVARRPRHRGCGLCEAVLGGSGGAGGGLADRALLPALHPDDRAEVEARIGRALAGWRRLRGGIPAVAGRWQHPLGGGARPLRARRGRAPHALPRRRRRHHRTQRAEEGKELLARELSHRIKNIFTVVGGMVSLSASVRRPRCGALPARCGGG